MQNVFLSVSVCCVSAAGAVNYVFAWQPATIIERRKQYRVEKVTSQMLEREAYDRRLCLSNLHSLHFALVH